MIHRWIYNETLYFVTSHHVVQRKDILITKLVISYIYLDYNRVNQRSSGDEDLGLCGNRGDALYIQGK